MTKAAEVYERVEALVAGGARKAEAFRTLAEEFDQPVNSVRGAYYAHTRGSGTGTVRKPRSNGDPIQNAVAVLQRAIDSIDGEIADAKERAELAKAEYEHLRDTAKERTAALQAKIDALSA